MIGIVGDTDQGALDLLTLNGFQLKRFDSVPASEKLTGLIIRSAHNIGENELIALPNLKILVTATSGYDHIALDRCQAHFVKVYHTPEAAVQSVAELTLMMSIALLRKLTNLNMQLTGGMKARNKLRRGSTLEQMSWGIVGLGRIGQRVAELIQPLCHKVLVYDPYVTETDVDFDEFLGSSDIVSLHIPLSAETRHMISDEALKSMRDSAFLINVARGKVVDEAALINALNTGQIAGAGLDVFDSEPLPENSPLLKSDKVVLTPHIGAYCHQSFQRACLQAAETIVDFFANRSPKHELPESALWAAQRVI